MKKLLGICEDCGSPYAVQVFEDDTINVIGNGNECGCGSREFSLVTEHV